MHMKSRRKCELLLCNFGFFFHRKKNVLRILTTKGNGIQVQRQYYYTDTQRSKRNLLKFVIQFYTMLHSEKSKFFKYSSHKN